MRRELSASWHIGRTKEEVGGITAAHLAWTAMGAPAASWLPCSTGLRLVASLKVAAAVMQRAPPP